MDHESKLPEFHISPGESCLITEPGILCTLLGSCVGITFWVRRLKIGALCHAMLPAYPVRRPAQVTQAAVSRYVDSTIRDLAAQFDALGVSREETEVKVFGGADVLNIRSPGARPTVGTLNREAAIRILRAEGYRVAAASLGGDSGMQIHFNTGNGEVLLRRFGRARQEKSPPPARAGPKKTP